ncbi:MAG: MBL fold metallo-hydrolase [Clostridium sp.]
MKITTLIENTGDDEGLLKNEHGLSFFIETSHGNILFDTGQSGDFIENAEKMNIDLRTTDKVILSHSHYDHCRGLKRLFNTFEINTNVVLGKNFFLNRERYRYVTKDEKDLYLKYGKYKFIGIDFDEEYLKSKKAEISYVSEKMMKINDEIYVFSNFERIHEKEKENRNMMIKVSEDKFVTDKFDDEICIGVKCDYGLIILLGCSHPGILNIIDSIRKVSGERIIGIIGGTHLIKSDEERIEETAEYLKKLDLKFIGLSHCTGEKAVRIINKKCKNIFSNKTGSIIEF